MSWIHIDDMANGIIWLLNNDLRGPFNMVSPTRHVTSSSLTRSDMRLTAGGYARPGRHRAPDDGNPPCWSLAARAPPKRLEASGFASLV
jgi:nucleoside-diphosphate-sugar epimerase